MIISTTCAYHEERMIVPHLKALRHVNERIVLASETPWHGVREESAGKMIEALNRAQQGDPTDPLYPTQDFLLVEKPWKTEADQRNTGIVMAAALGAYWVLTLDADEFLQEEHLKKFCDWLYTLPESVYAVAASRMLTYWKKGFVIDPPETHTPIVAVRTDVRFTENRCISTNFVLAPQQWPLHHFSYARTDEEVARKLRTFSHAPEHNGSWYRDVWQKWTPEMMNFHPSNPEQYTKAIPVEVPEEFKEVVNFE